MGDELLWSKKVEIVQYYFNDYHYQCHAATVIILTSAPKRIREITRNENLKLMHYPIQG